MPSRTASGRRSPAETPGAWGGWDSPAFPPGVLPAYVPSVIQDRARALWLRLVADRPQNEGVIPSMQLRAMTKGYERALLSVGLTVERGAWRVLCEACRRRVLFVVLELGQWRCVKCAQPSTELARSLAAYACAARVGLVGAVLKGYQKRALGALERAVQNPGRGIATPLDVAVATGLLARERPPTRRTRPGRSDPQGFPWSRIDYSTSPWRRHIGWRVFDAVVELNLHPQAVKAKLLESARHGGLT